ncbi:MULTISPECIES: sarcosine oxidase subunit alpha family protein [unclassified Roseitalea]|uniref:sarcosine oxidase subunit alpha family protein n=1 Tax=unclassified Roseitalea TaxID=2639107 RepID=UPI002740022D|nr:MULTISPECIES: sarcosine oxidase subunit alpha family protein [unclassified Roseitalea]
MTAATQTQTNRVAGAGRLSPASPVRFCFDGQAYQGLAGDTLASALLANDVHLVGRSFKYHRPRGIVTAGPEEPNALVGIARGSARRQPNVRATMQEIHDGLDAFSQNRWPSLSLDVGEVNDWASPLLAAGFYYKTFMWPRRAWGALYEPFIRQAAGLGRAPDEPDPDSYANRFAHCDVLVCGGGPAGLAAALAAAESGASVIVCDERAGFGGALHFETEAVIDGQAGFDWASGVAARLVTMDNVRVLPRTTAFGYYAQNMVGLVEQRGDHLANPGPVRERLWQVRAKRVILATGAIERPMVFANNDRPAIMLAGAARHYLNHCSVRIGTTIGVFTANDGAYAAAFELSRAGAGIAAIVDVRTAPDPALLDEAEALGIEVLTGHTVIAAGGKLRVSSMVTRPVDGGARRVIPIDALIMSAGWTPSVHLFSQSRGKLRFEAAGQRFVPGEAAQECRSVGACNGTDDLAATVEEALAAGEDAARAARGARAKKAGIGVRVEGAGRWRGAMAGAAPNPDSGKVVKAFVDFQNDVTEKDIRLAVQEGFHSIEHVKRFTTSGMATDQGKLSNMHALAIAAERLGRPIPEVGLTTFRAPYTPVTFGALVGHDRGALFEPTRRTPMHGAHEALGAVFEDVGQWKRAWYYPQAGEDMAAAVNRECLAVRRTAGLFDASTLGKIEVVGPDAAEFLDLLYTNPFRKLGVGRLRYGVMCGEDGFIYDDGVIGRLAEDRFHVTTTTGGAARVLGRMEDYLQTEFTHLNVWLTSVSEQWAVIALQGPRAEAILAPFVDGMDIGREAMAFMSCRQGTFEGVPMRLFRMSFAGEDGFEINVPADHGRAVWDTLLARVTEIGGRAYGTEAMHVLRAEKGFIIVGQDTDGTVTPHDAGLSWAVGRKKSDFVGMRGLMRPDLVADGRRQLVGLRVGNGVGVIDEGAQIVAEPEAGRAIGWVSSSYWSENLGRPIAMALIENGFSRMGETVFVADAGGAMAVEIMGTDFLAERGGHDHG